MLVVIQLYIIKSWHDHGRELPTPNAPNCGTFHAYIYKANKPQPKKRGYLSSFQSVNNQPNETPKK